MIEQLIETVQRRWPELPVWQGSETSLHCVLRPLGRLVVIELVNDRQTAAQRAQEAAIMASGGIYRTAQDLDDALSVIVGLERDGLLRVPSRASEWAVAMMEMFFERYGRAGDWSLGDAMKMKDFATRARGLALVTKD